MEIGPCSASPPSCFGLRKTPARAVRMTPVKIITDKSEWRELERQLAEGSSFDRLLEREEEMESETCGSALPCSHTSPSGNAQMRWLQRALNRVSAFGIAENGFPSIQTRRALQKFQSEQGLRPTGILGPKTRATLIQLSGMPAPRPRVEHNGDASEAEMEAPSGRCPADSPYVIRGFNQYSDDIRSLPQGQGTKTARLATEITGGKLGSPGVAPVTEVVVVGHADMDAAREKREPGFLQFMSEKRALAVLKDLQCKVYSKSRQVATEVRWTVLGRGAKALTVSNPRTEAERKCNRRVEIMLLRSPQPSPRLESTQYPNVTKDLVTFGGIYSAALQGTSGKYDSPQAAESKARQIADRVLPFLVRRKENIRKANPGCEDNDSPLFQARLQQAIQGAASRFDDPDVVVSKAAEAAETADFGWLQETRKLEWKYATLPQPMAPDCEIIRGKVPGPARYALCGTHGHILDTTARTVFAYDLDDYKKRLRR